ncbi:MAG: DUF2723 domain-containing protein [bacterium]
MDSETKRLNWRMSAIGGGFVFLISFIVYFRSVAVTTSFWDCGEFIACSRILGVMHPPGAPLYLLIGRVLTMLPFFKDMGLRVNMFSVLVSAATVLLTYLIIVQLIQRWRGEAKSWEDRLIIYLSGVFGAMAFAFTDSFWFNAVEAEVYAFSMLFTALVIWLALYWEERSEKAGSILLIFFVFYMFGLATGVHLLNILAFPFVLLIAYFHDNQTVKRLLLLIFIQAAVPFFLYVTFFQFNPTSKSFEQMLAHQQKAWNFMLWFGVIWVGVSLVYVYFKDRSVFLVWWVIPALVVLGYSLYIAIYIRAGLKPPINENDPSTFKAMMDYFGRKQYGDQSMLLTFLHRQADFWHYQIQMMYTRYFGWQFIGRGITLDAQDRIVEILSLRGLYGLPFVVGLWGAVHHFYKDWKRAVAVLVLFFLTGYAVILYLNQPDPQPRERDYSYVGSFFAFALWIGIGMAGALEWISDALKGKKMLKKAAFSLAGLLLFIAVPLNLYAFHHKSHSRAGDYVAWDYSYNILESCEPDGIIFTNGDNDTFPLWYLQEVEGIRKDVRVVNLSLLNTPWYIKQLRDLEPKVPLNLSDNVIDTLFPIAWESKKVSIPVPENVIEELKPTLDSIEVKSLSRGMTFTLNPTFANNTGLRVQDRMILRILQVNQWKRPVYFAMTVSTDNKMGLEPYFRMDGLAFKIMPYEVRQLDKDRLRTNLLEKFRYRGLNDPHVYFNVDVLKLLQNYRSTYMELARHYLNEGKKDEALFILDEMSKRMPQEVIPYSDERLAVVVASLYKSAGRSGEIEERIKHVIPGRLLSSEDRVLLADYYAQILQDWTRAEEMYRQIIRENPSEVHAYSGLFQTYSMSRQYDKGIALLEQWLLGHPGDAGAKKELEEMKRLAAADSLQNPVEDKK